MSSKAEAKSCFVEAGRGVSSVDLRWSYQPQLSALRESVSDAFYVSCLFLKSQTDDPGSFHTISRRGRVQIFIEPTSCYGFTLTPFSGGRPGWNHLLPPTPTSCLIKAVVTPIIIEAPTNEGERLARTPTNSWREVAEESADEHCVALWGGSDFVFLTGAYSIEGFKYRIQSTCPQLSAVFQLCFENFPCAPTILNPDGAVRNLLSLPKTVFDRPGHPPPRPPGLLKTIAAGSTSSTRGAPAAVPSTATGHEEDERRSRFNAEVKRLTERLVEAEGKVRELEAAKIEGSGESSKRRGEEVVERTGKRLRVPVRPGDEVLFIASDTVKEEDDGKKEEKEEQEPLRIKKESGENGGA